MTTPIVPAAGSIRTTKTSSRVIIRSIGQHTFLDITAVANLDFEGRQVPTQTTPFESTERPFSGNFFGRPNSFFTLNFFSLSFDLFHGDAAFKPVDWRIKLTPTLGVSNFSFSELAQSQPQRAPGRRSNPGRLGTPGGVRRVQARRLGA